MPTHLFTRILHAIGAHDPARERLRKTLSITGGIFVSVLWGWGVVHFLHADTGMLAMSVFLSMMTGVFVKDSTAPARVVTAALLIPTVVLIPTLATLLSGNRTVLLVCFVLLSGVAVWIRRWGPRATTLGTLSFFAYFFTLFMRPTLEDLPPFLLIAAGAATTQLGVKLIMWVSRHPERELGTLLHELRIATAAAIDAAATPDHDRAQQARLGRVDAMWRAITGWTKDFRTESFSDWDAETLALRVMDVCVHTEEACHELIVGHSTGADLRTALGHVSAALDEHAPAPRLADAESWARQVVAEVEAAAGLDAATHADVCTYRLAECVLAHARLKEIRLHRRSAPPAMVDDPTSVGSPGSADGAPSVGGPDTTATTTTPALASTDPGPDAPHAAPAAVEDTGDPKRFRWIAWRDWTPTSRLAIQAMTATAIASVVGELISATRWYWAVLTAFLVFLSTTTRSGILTRAYRRVLGTVIGLVAGVALTYLAHDNTAALVAIGLVGIMGMIYFAPLNYMYAASFITVMLVALYDMLGVLHGHLLALRLEETLAGALCGVVCAYLLLSTTSRPSLLKEVDAYFDAIDDVLAEGAAVATDRTRIPALLDAVHTVEAAQADVDDTISAMSAAFLIIGHDRVDSARDLTAYGTRSSVRFAQVLVDAGTPETAAALSRESDALGTGVARARAAASQAREQVHHVTTLPGRRHLEPGPPHSAEVADDHDADNADDGQLTTGSDPAVHTALMALSRLTWVMNHLSEVLTPSDDTALNRLRAHAL